MIRIAMAVLATTLVAPSLFAAARVAKANSATPAEVVNWTAGVSYSYDHSGNITQIGADRFAYDRVGRLVEAEINGVTRTYQYDAFANRTGCSHAPGTPELSDCQFGIGIEPASNRIKNVEYDHAGNVETFAGHRYTYDHVNMPRRDDAARSREFVYTANDLRIAVYDVGSQWNWSLRDFGGKVVREFTSDPSFNQWTWKRDYVFRGSLMLASRQVANATPVTYHYHVDHLGSPRRVTDHNNRTVGFRDYYAFGPTISGGLTEPVAGSLQYTGHERDQSSTGEGPETLDYMLARYYSPVAARFLALDPKLGRASVPQSWNRYAYARNNPLRFLDPDGKAVLEFKIEHFIPTRYAIAPHGIYLGDGRGFSAAADRTFRTQQTIRIETDPKKSASGFLGSSAATGITANFLPSLFGKAPLLGHASGSSLQTEPLGRASDGTVMMKVRQNEELPSSASFGIGLAGTGIRSELFIAVGTDGTVEAVGTRSGYPAMQVSVSVDGGAEELIYVAPAMWDGLGIWFDEQLHFKMKPAGACIEGTPECR